ncbi:MAG: response regulator [Haloquadratum sp.]
MTDGTVLVGEDDTKLLQLFELWLRESYTVRGVATGDDLLDALETGVVAVVTDWRLDGTSQTALLDAIDRAGVDPGIVVTSGVRPDADLDQYGVDSVLEKPVDREELLDAVRAAVTAPPTVQG